MEYPFVIKLIERKFYFIVIFSDGTNYGITKYMIGDYSLPVKGDLKPNVLICWNNIKADFKELVKDSTDEERRELYTALHAQYIKKSNRGALAIPTAADSLSEKTLERVL